MQTGHNFEIFQDRTDIIIGQRWKERIDTVIDGSTFLIAVITPLFLNSDMCREEVQQFIKREKALKRDDLIVPILYLDSPALRDPSDTIAVELSCRQHYYWDDLRFEPFESTQYRRGVAEVATMIRQAIQSSKAKPNESLVVEQPNDSDTSNPDSDPGFIEILVETEHALPMFVQTIEEFAQRLTDLSVMAESATFDMNSANASGKPASARLIILRRFAKRLEPLAKDIEILTDDYTDQLARVDFGMKAISSQISKRTSVEDLEAAVNFKESLDELVEQGEFGMNALQELRNSISQLNKLSSTVRPVLNRISKSIDKILPSRDNFSSWRDDLNQALVDRELLNDL